MLSVVLISLFLISSLNSQCQRCANSQNYYQTIPLIRYQNPPIQPFFNFANLLNHQPKNHQFMSYSPNPRILNVFGQDAAIFGSAIGKSIAQHIQETISNQKTTTVPQFSSQPAASSSSKLRNAEAEESRISSTTYSQPSSTWSTPSSHPPEDLPTVQQSFTPIPSTPSYRSMIPNGFGEIPGMLPPPSNHQPFMYTPLRSLYEIHPSFYTRKEYQKTN